jgi:hypothetical protein
VCIEGKSSVCYGQRIRIEEGRLFLLRNFLVEASALPRGEADPDRQTTVVEKLPAPELRRLADNRGQYHRLNS